MADVILKAAALTAEAFAPFGDVIEIGDRRPRWINEGTCERFDDVAQPDVMAAGGRPMISIVAAAGDAALSSRIRAYRSSGNQGVNYRRNTWHHALLALERTSHFLVVDRGGPGENCDETLVDDAVVVIAAA